MHDFSDISVTVKQWNWKSKINHRTVDYNPKPVLSLVNGMRCLCSLVIPSVRVLILQTNCDRLSPWAACTLDLSHLFIMETACISILGDNQNLTRRDPEQSDLILSLILTSRLALLWAGIGLDEIRRILLIEVFLWVSWCASISAHANRRLLLGSSLRISFSLKTSV